ncbi:MAG: hypothetical protein MUO76_09795, partial [Anaerolineaceae bacterium]|nr:hypothetical protein [Anaerolineaceae bacterium]
SNALGWNSGLYLKISRICEIPDQQYTRVNCTIEQYKAMSGTSNKASHKKEKRFLSNIAYNFQSCLTLVFKLCWCKIVIMVAFYTNIKELHYGA